MGMKKGSIISDHSYFSVPPPPARVHLMGICGTGMGALAGMFFESGYRVSGSDNGIYPPMSDFLRDLGIPVKEGYSPANLDPTPDIVVVGNVIRRSNPEAAALDELGIPYISMTTALNRFFIRDRKRIVVTGTHGKTTVSSMIAWILTRERLDPSFMIGGLPGNFGRSYRLGNGPHFVIEGDEYDTAYFDKSPKFLHYLPDVAVITSCEFDHADIYRNIEQIEDQFTALAAMIPRNGCLVAWGEDERVRRIARSASSRVLLYGSGGDSDWSVDYPGAGGNGTAVIRKGERSIGTVTMPMAGRHNLVNALAAVAVADCLGIDAHKAVNALSSFRGVRRRQEVRGEVAGVTVIDDFAHHPTAVRATCAAIRSRFPSRRLIAVFEPRTNTSKRNFFQQEYASAFDEADLVLVREPSGVDEIPLPERFDSRLLAEDLLHRGKTARAFAESGELLDVLAADSQSGDVVLVMSNGSFDNLIPRLLDCLKERVP